MIYKPHHNAIREEACIKYYVSYKVCAENAKGTKCHDCANSKGKVHHIVMWNALNSLPHVHIDSHAVEQAKIHMRFYCDLRIPLCIHFLASQGNTWEI